ncbi:uncharacterized protein A4U43_C04F4770 [Asparagus officinalis]|uniref:RRM domain-containing protein n=1 Tax=Asparagus officinalis TaxID=4686 RepID=A0A5P1EYD3_ASPOF|nr:uncharacterized protein A4U43_C04F4770 [Asparagus officinalis]
MQFSRFLFYHDRQRLSLSIEDEASRVRVQDSEKCRDLEVKVRRSELKCCFIMLQRFWGERSGSCLHLGGNGDHASSLFKFGCLRSDFGARLNLVGTSRLILFWVWLCPPLSIWWMLHLQLVHLYHPNPRRNLLVTLLLQLAQPHNLKERLSSNLLNRRRRPIDLTSSEGIHREGEPRPGLLELRAVSPCETITKVFIGGLQLSVDSDHLKEFYTKFGPVEEAIVIIIKTGFSSTTLDPDPELFETAQFQTYTLL